MGLCNVVFKWKNVVFKWKMVYIYMGKEIQKLTIRANNLLNHIIHQHLISFIAWRTLILSSYLFDVTSIAPMPKGSFKIMNMKNYLNYFF